MIKENGCDKSAPARREALAVWGSHLTHLSSKKDGLYRLWQLYADGVGELWGEGDLVAHVPSLTSWRPVYDESSDNLGSRFDALTRYRQLYELHQEQELIPEIAIPMATMDGVICKLWTTKELRAFGFIDFKYGTLTVDNLLTEELQLPEFRPEPTRGLYCYGDTTHNFFEKTVKVAGKKKVSLTDRENRALLLFESHMGEIVEYSEIDQLFNDLQGKNFSGIRLEMLQSLRRKFGDTDDNRRYYPNGKIYKYEVFQQNYKPHGIRYVPRDSSFI